MSIKLIVGLRNPGSAYAQTRHNAGGWFVTALAHDYNASFQPDKKLHAELAHIPMGDDLSSCRAMLPFVFMNHSGLSVQAVSRFYRIEPNEILVAHDEMDLTVGSIKLKTGGGHGGHNGLRDIAHQLGSQNFHRLRIGIGHPGHKDLVLNYVLGKPTSDDRQLLLDAIKRAVAVMPVLLLDGMSVAMNQLNGS